MTGIFNLITQHYSKLNILPIIVAINIIIAVLLHFLSKRKIVKFLPSIFMGIGAIVILVYALRIFTSQRGIDLTWIAIFLGTAALVGILVCFIIDLIVSIKSSNEKVDNKVTKKNPSKKAMVNKTEKKRVAKKSNKKRNSNSQSKYYTKKIKLEDKDRVRANKIKKEKETITFESLD